MRWWDATEKKMKAEEEQLDMEEKILREKTNNLHFTSLYTNKIPHLKPTTHNTQDFLFNIQRSLSNVTKKAFKSWCSLRKNR